MKKIINGRKYDTETAKKLVIGAMDIHVLTSIIARKPYILRKQENISCTEKVVL